MWLDQHDRGTYKLHWRAGVEMRCNTPITSSHGASGITCRILCRRAAAPPRRPQLDLKPGRLHDRDRLADEAAGQTWSALTTDAAACEQIDLPGDTLRGRLLRHHKGPLHQQVR